MEASRRFKAVLLLVQAEHAEGQEEEGDAHLITKGLEVRSCVDIENNLLSLLTLQGCSSLRPHQGTTTSIVEFMETTTRLMHIAWGSISEPHEVVRVAAQEMRTLENDRKGLEKDRKGMERHLFEASKASKASDQRPTSRNKMASSTPEAPIAPAISTGGGPGSNSCSPIIKQQPMPQLGSTEMNKTSEPFHFRSMRPSKLEITSESQASTAHIEWPLLRAW